MACLFCKIVAGEIPSKKVFEDDRVYAFPRYQSTGCHPCTGGAAQTHCFAGRGRRRGFRSCWDIFTWSRHELH